MLRFFVLRFGSALIVLFATSAIVFGLAHKSGDPRDVMLNQYSTQADWVAWGKRYGLDKPLVVQYLIWAGHALRGDLGTSTRASQPVTHVIWERLPATLELAGSGFLVALIVGVPLGVMSAIRRGTFWDYLGRTFALFGQALPPFWLGLELIFIFAVDVHFLPTSGKGGIDHLVLPSVTLGWLIASGILRMVRSSMLDALDSEYVRFARAKGVRPGMVVWKHALRNALLAPLTYAGLILALLITGTVVTETVFAWPGLGMLAVQSANNDDFPTMTGIVLLTTVMYLSVNTLTDLAYAVLDPRIRY